MANNKLPNKVLKFIRDIDTYALKINTPLREASENQTIDPTKFAEVKLWKLNWIKNKTKDGGAQNVVINRKENNHIVLKSLTKKNGSLWSSCAPNELVNLVDTNKGLYEVLHEFPMKVYFDIDKKPFNDEHGEYLQDCLTTISSYFKDASFAVSGSIESINGEYKTSYHIVLNNYVLRNADDRETMKLLVKHLRDHHDDGFDPKVYSKKSEFQTHQSKQARQTTTKSHHQSNCNRALRLLFCQSGCSTASGFRISGAPG